MTNPSRFYFLAALLLLTVTARGDDGARDLMDVFNIALTQDADYAAAAFEYQNIRTNLSLARTTFLPTLSVQGTASRTRENDLSPDAENTGDTDYFSSLNADWTLFNLQSLRTYRQTKLQTLAAQTQFEDARAALILRVAERYFGLLAARDNLEVAHRQQAAILRQRDFTKQRLTVGIGTRADLFDAEARYQQSRADVIAAQNQIATAAAALKQVTGGAVDELVTLREDAPLQSPRPALVGEWTVYALKNNLALRAQNFNLNIAREEIKKQRAARAPRIDIRARREWRDGADDVATGSGMNQQSRNNASNNSQADSQSVAATVNWTLFQGGAIHLRTKAAGYRFNAAERARESLRRQIVTDTTVAYLAVAGGVSQVNAFADAVRAGESALRAKEEGFRAGLTTNIDVLDAQRDLSRSRTNYLRARYDFILSVLRLERAAGDLDEADVRRVNDWLAK